MALILSLLLMDLVLSVAMDCIRLITIPAKNVSPIVLIAPTITLALTVPQDSALMEPTIAGSAMLPTAFNATLKIPVLPAMLLILSTVEIILVTANILMNCWQIILVFVLLEDQATLEALADALILNVLFAIRTAAYVHPANPATSSAITYAFKSVIFLIVLNAIPSIIVKHATSIKH